MDASFTFLQNLSLRGLLARNDAPRVSEEEWAGFAKAEWDSDRFQFSLEHLNLQENFLPEMGFVSRAEANWKGVRRNLAQASYKPRPGIEGIRQFEFSSSLDYITNQQGLLDTREAEWGWSTDFESGDAVEFGFSRNFERLPGPLQIRRGGTVLATVPPGDYRSNEYELMVRPFGGRSLSGFFRFEVGGYYDGNQTSLDISPEFKASANLSIEPGYGRTTISLPGAASFTIQELNSDINYSFSQKWLTRTTLQLNSQEKQFAANFRLNYIFRPGDDLFIVYNETRTYGSEGGLQNRALIVKTTYSFDF